MKIVNPTALIGENLAAEFLKKNGYKIIDRNFRIRNGEIDIIALKNKTLVFVEVKTRKSFKYGTPLESITPHKLNDIKRTAYVYRNMHSKLPELMRVDAVSVVLNEYNNADRIEHVENITV